MGKFAENLNLGKSVLPHPCFSETLKTLGGGQILSGIAHNE